MKREFAVIMSFDCSALSDRQLVRVLGLWERAGCIQVQSESGRVIVSMQSLECRCFFRGGDGVGVMQRAYPLTQILSAQYEQGVEQLIAP